MRTFLNVPFSENEIAKRLGAQWSTAYKSWYIEDVENVRPFMKWMPKHLTQPIKSNSEEVSNVKKKKTKSKKFYFRRKKKK